MFVGLSEIELEPGMLLADTCRCVAGHFSDKEALGRPGIWQGIPQGERVIRQQAASYRDRALEVDVTAPAHLLWYDSWRTGWGALGARGSQAWTS
jgi:hypothetical protein